MSLQVQTQRRLVAKAEGDNMASIAKYVIILNATILFGILLLFACGMVALTMYPEQAKQFISGEHFK